MCTALCFRQQDTYFGRNLDVDFSFCEKVVVTPRQFAFPLPNGKKIVTRYALIGTAAVFQNIPMYYEATNEVGLSIAGLNFPDNAVYLEPKKDFLNLPPFALIPYLLGKAANVQEARELLQNVRLTNVAFRKDLPLSPLHYLLSDAKESIVLEPMADGLKIYDNPYDVLTNNPPFPYHHWNMQNYMHLSKENATNHFSAQYDLKPYGVGMGSIGLPGDTSSASRFVRAAFHLTNSACKDVEEENVAQFFHVLDSVAMVKGSTMTKGNGHDITLYSCCCNVQKGIYYYKTYLNNQINAVQLHHTDLNAKELTIYPLRLEQNVFYEN